MTEGTIELASFFEAGELDAQGYERFADAAHVSFHARERFETLTADYGQKVEKGTGEALRLALACLILGRFRESLEHFGRSPAGRMRHYYSGEAALALSRFDEAVTEFGQAAARGWDALEADMRAAVALVRKRDLVGAEKLLRKHEAAGSNRASWWYVRGLAAEVTGQREQAGDAYERALELHPEHVEATFCCARLCDQWGDDERALELYERLTAKPRAFVNALLNAAAIFEDRGRYDAAMVCVRRVLHAYPNHKRARLFHKSVESCRHMVIEEGHPEPVDASTRLLATPLSEFELSVRARNCLKKMGIRTLGELIRLNEVELLAYKNFGETSLTEIKALLVKKGLHLGMRPEELETPAAAEPAPAPKPVMPPGQEALLSKPVSDLELSVRSRRCLQRLNVQTLGDLVQFTEADLLATRNFGVTSLNEIKARLVEVGVQLAPKKPG